MKTKTNSLILPGKVRLLGPLSFIGLREVGPRRGAVIGPRVLFCVYGTTFPLPGRDDAVEDVAHLVGVHLPLDPGKVLVNQAVNRTVDQPRVGFLVRAGFGVGFGAAGPVVFVVVVVVVLLFSDRRSSHGQGGVGKLGRGRERKTRTREDTRREEVHKANGKSTRRSTEALM